MDITKGKITMEEEYQQGFEVMKKKTDRPPTDITSEQWFWDMGVMS